MPQPQFLRAGLHRAGIRYYDVFIRDQPQEWLVVKKKGAGYFFGRSTYKGKKASCPLFVSSGDIVIARLDLSLPGLTGQFIRKKSLNSR